MWYLCVFYHRLLDYRKAEVESLAHLFGVLEDGSALQWKLPQHHHPDSPFHFVYLPSEDVARNIANRTGDLYQCESSNYKGLGDDYKMWLFRSTDNRPGWVRTPCEIESFKEVVGHSAALFSRVSKPLMLMGPNHSRNN
ncbi:hypothetical protein CK203_031190 [Vitis vinifera]|uniref:Uncharacterized protein n=1 Tax=Vitis vinifera TaxID=29760 RepID=A0A438J0K2_VITVI|nr:hypothetical protein CK203_031190 [Vitis vinifera]